MMNLLFVLLRSVKFQPRNVALKAIILYTRTSWQITDFATFCTCLVIVINCSCRVNHGTIFSKRSSCFGRTDLNKAKQPTFSSSYTDLSPSCVLYTNGFDRLLLICFEKQLRRWLSSSAWQPASGSWCWSSACASSDGKSIIYCFCVKIGLHQLTYQISDCK